MIDTTVIFTLEYIPSQIYNICFISGNSYYWVRARIYISHCVLSSSLGALPRSRPALWGPLVHGDENGVHEGVCRMHHALSHLCILGMRNRQHSWLVSFSYILHYYGKIYFTKLFEFLNLCIAVLRIRIRLIRKILASWIRIRKNMR